MTARNTATRAQAIAAAIDKFQGDDFLYHWEDHEYINGICSVIADTFGVNDPENARSEVWAELNAAFNAEKVRQAAKRLRRSLHMQEQSDEERMVTPEEAVRLVAGAARALLAAIGEGEQ